MTKSRYLGTTPQQLTAEDKEYVKLIQAGSKKAPAFRKAYPNHPQVIRWKNAEPGSPDRQKAVELVISAAKNKLQAKYMQGAIVSYQKSMDRFSDLSLVAATDLVQNARSEKVRADLAIEGIRQKVGSPTQKVESQQDTRVILQFGNKPDERDVLEGEVV